LVSEDYVLYLVLSPHNNVLKYCHEIFNTDSTLTLWQSKVGEFMVNFACKDEALAGKRGLISHYTRTVGRRYA
jgi:hypothetical protein